jgi:COP9 signalosome complex subunit 5
MKILKHALSGVKKGREGPLGMPVEVMGLLIGRIDEGGTLIVLDSAPLPVEGEAAFVTAGEKVNEYITQLGDSMDLKRQERFVGWYHSHPFDVGTHPCWFLSNTDLQSQNSYQIALPLWTALVIDPLRSIARHVRLSSYPSLFFPVSRQAPELGVFRVLGIHSQLHCDVTLFSL